MQITKERLTKEQLLDAARSAAKYLPAASADIMNELATRLDVTSVALSEAMAQRTIAAADAVEMFAAEIGSPYEDRDGEHYDDGFNRAIEVTKKKALKFALQLREGK